MKTTVLAAALLALLTSPAAAAERVPDRVPQQEFVGDWCVDQNAPKASIDDKWWTANGRNELAMISTRASDAAVAAPTPPRAVPAPPGNRDRRRPPVAIADDEAGVGLLDGPGRREAALGHDRLVGIEDEGAYVSSRLRARSAAS